MNQAQKLHETYIAELERLVKSFNAQGETYKEGGHTEDAVRVYRTAMTLQGLIQRFNKMYAEFQLQEETIAITYKKFKSEEVEILKDSLSTEFYKKFPNP